MALLATLGDSEMCEAPAELITSSELAARLKLTAETVREWSRTGKIPRIAITKKCVRYDYDAVVHALAERSEARDGN